MPTHYNIAVAGATGAVGKEMIDILQQRDFPVATLHPLASERSLGKSLQFRGKHTPIQNLAEFDFTQADIALFSAGGAVSAEYAPQAAQAGCIVIDNSSHFRRDPHIPLVIPEVNPQAIADYRNANLIANPNCSTIQLLVALKPLHDAATLRRLTVATYQAVSGAGNAAIDELAQNSAARLSGADFTPRQFPSPIAFNVIPHIDQFQDNGYTREEMKMVWETRKIMGDDSLEINPTAARVPVFFGHSEAVHITTAQALDAAQARQILATAPGVRVIDDPASNAYPTPSEHAAGQDEVFVGRIRNDLDSPTGLNLWIVSDNVRKGAALNAVQIAEILAEKYL